MDYIDGLQKAIQYIEEHITEKIDVEEISKIVYTSSFSFQKVFNAVCGVGIAEYIRNRRMSLAGNDLSNGKEKVIDVAYKYCYDTPESFTRAFTKFHGVTPTDVKNGFPHKIYLPFSIKIVVKGGRTMDYRIEKLQDFKVLVKKKRFPKDKDVNSRIIPEFWKESVTNGTVERLVSYVNKENIFKDSIVGIGLEYNDGESDFPYGIGVHYNGEPVKDNDFDIVDIKENTFVVFQIKGRMPEAFKNVYEYLFTEFFPNSEYAPTGIEIEAYPSADVKNDNYCWELWFSVKKK